MYFKGVVLVPKSKTVSHEFDLNIMKILINVYVLSGSWKGESPCFNWFMSGTGSVCSVPCHLSDLRKLSLKE